VPSVAWTSSAEAEAEREYVVIATRFVLARHGHLPAFFRATQELWPRLVESDGVLGYSLDGDLRRRTLRTLSAWRDSAAVEAFVRSAPHALVVAQTQTWMATSTILTWTVRGAQLPMTWSQVDEKFDTAASPPA